MLDRLLAGRNSYPRILNRVIDHLADRPMSPLGRIAALRYGRPPESAHPPILTADPTAQASVFIGPVNYAGQGRAWAESLMAAQPTVQAVNMAIDVPGGFDFAADAVVPVPVYHNGHSWQKKQADAATRFSHVLIEAEEPLFGRLFRREVAREAHHLQSHGVSVAYMAHGTDIRRPSEHRQRTPWSPYLDPQMYTQRLETLASRHQQLLNDSGASLFVSTPDLIDDLPAATWCPVVVDPQRWATDEPEAHEAPLRVMHAPSSALIKGTHLIEPTLRELHRRGIIDYMPVTGVSSEEMPQHYARADVVLDQFRLGSYGVAACEAMAAGLTVVGHVTESVRERVKAITGLSLPVLEATPATLEDVLIRLARDRAALPTHRRDGIAFVKHVHDGRLSSRILLDGWIAASEETAA